MLHLINTELTDEPLEIFMPTIADWLADTKEQTITHIATGCRFYAFPVQRDGFHIPFASKQIALRFIGMQDQRPTPSTDEIMRIGTQGILWITSYTLESSRPLSSR
jgi:hypothetical protein